MVTVDAAGQRLRVGRRAAAVPRSVIRVGLAVLALVLLGAVPAAAQIEGLDVVSDTTFVPAPDDGVIRVVATFVLTNEKPNSQSAYSSIQYYYDRFPLLLPNAAEEITAVVDGSRASVKVTPYEDDEKAVIAEIRLPKSIFYLQSATIRLSYSLRGGAARDAGAWVRVNPAYVAFPVWACCDPGQTRVRIEMPAGFDTEFSGSQSLEPLSSEPPVYVADIADPSQFFTMTYGRSDEGLDLTTTRVDGIEITIAGWPDDPEWRSFVRAEVESGLPMLADLTGLAATVTDLRLVETITPYLYGYAGWYDSATNRIEVGENLDPQVILHELSHIWFNQELFSERWLNEGFAEVFSNAALSASGRVAALPSRPDLTEPGAVALHDWNAPTDVSEEEAAAAEAYGYNASWYVIDSLGREVGVDGLSAVLAAADRDELSYLASDGRAPETRSSGSNDWRRLLDLVEQRAGAVDAERLFRAYVLAPDEVAELADRRAAIDRWEELVARTGTWEAPIGLRVLLSSWRFDDVDAFVGAAHEALVARDAVTSAAAVLSLTPPPDVELAYEAAELLGDVRAVIDRVAAQQLALQLVADTEDAIGEDFGVWARWGLRGTDLDAEYAQVRAAFQNNDFVAVAFEAAEVRRLIADAPGDAREFWLRVGIAVVAGVVLVVALTWAIRRSRRTRRHPDALHLAAVPDSDVGGVDRVAGDPLAPRSPYLVEDEGA